MNNFLWSLQLLLAAVFVLAGGVKLTQPATRVRPLAPPFFSLAFLRMLGALELLGALGVVLPTLTSYWPRVTALAAGALALVLAAAALVHAGQREHNRLPLLLVLLTAALVVAWGRW
ncbi:DoxX family protein [Hymenobacter negativus]|uniref:DoxX family protein n=1 Tax=Hymenobacter negativus TaxID=2795026 RepID=A0ABS3QLI4_9BACT|nr:DoxX family protein [Hymenobacter negativus]MBO2011619.1 DoxX family protein [Hymenobacter negativus]